LIYINKATICAYILQNCVKACNIFNLVYNRAELFEHHKSEAVYGHGIFIRVWLHICCQKYHISFVICSLLL